MRLLQILFFGLVLVLGSCKENTAAENPKTEQIETEIAIEKPVSPLLNELGKFANPAFSDTTVIDGFFRFLELSENETPKAIDMNRALDLYSQMTKSKKPDSWPIFEVKGTDNVLLPVVGIGFGGAIWAKVLVDKKTLEIKKIEFQHKAESEGYGDAMTQSVFEYKFVGIKINLEKNTFALQKNIEKRVDDGVAIDGIAGATMTSQSVVEMVNNGLRKYQRYFESHQTGE